MGKNQRIIVKTGSIEYPVLLARQGWYLKKTIASRRRVFLVTNPTVFSLQGPTFLKNYLPSDLKVEKIFIGDGERYKSRRTAEEIYDQLFALEADRGDLMIAFGGGVVGDTAGFVAATFMRGMPLVQVPTTLLAMVDASIGGKVGINHPRGKNLIGAFYQPQAVIIDSVWLATLGQRELVEGLAEIIKIGFLSSEVFLRAAVNLDPSYNKSKKVFDAVIKEATAFKASVVTEDAYDRGLRAILNFGHTFAHAIEQVDRFRNYRHGEAVLAGMVGALYLSHANGCLSQKRLRSYLNLLSHWMRYLPPLKEPAMDYLSAMMVDKKKRDKQLNFVMMRKPGILLVGPSGTRAMIEHAIYNMQNFVNNRGRL